MFSEKFYRMNEIIAQCNISKSDYKDLYPLFVFDVSKQESEEKPNSLVDLSVFVKFRTIVPDNTNAFAVIISNKTFNLYSDGTNYIVM